MLLFLVSWTTVKRCSVESQKGIWPCNTSPEIIISAFKKSKFDFKNLLVVFNALHGLAPQYLLKRYEPVGHLRSPGKGCLIISSVSTKMGESVGTRYPIISGVPQHYHPLKLSWNIPFCLYLSVVWSASSILSCHILFYWFSLYSCLFYLARLYIVILINYCFLFDLLYLILFTIIIHPVL